MSVDNIVQQATGTFNATSGSATLPTGATAGNAILIVIGVLGTNHASNWTSTTVPSGFTVIQSAVSLSAYGGVGAYLKPVAAGGETSFTITIAVGAQHVTWAVFEIAGGDYDFTGLVHGYTGVSGSVTTQGWIYTTATTTTTYAGLGIAAFLAVSTNTTPPTVTSYDQGYYGIASQTTSGATPKAGTFAVAAKQILASGWQYTNAYVSPDAYGYAILIVISAAGARHTPILTSLSGAEIGTATSLSTATPESGVYAPWDEVVGTPAVTTSSPRSGAYAWELSSTAAAESLSWANTSPPDEVLYWGAPTLSVRFHVYFPTSLPSGDLAIAAAEGGSAANGMVLRYISASQKLGVKIGTGTEQVSDAVVVANQWIGVDYFYDPRATTHRCEWAVDYNATPGDPTGSVVQTTATTAGMSVSQVTRARFGWTSASTATVRYDDIAGSRMREAGLIGDVRVFPLKVDPAGTPTLTGTAANFRTFTSNGGVLTAWSAVNTRNVLSEVPFIIGASSDGLTQITAAGSDHVTVPMETYTCAPDYVPIGGRWYWAGWAASTTTGYIMFRPTDGVDHDDWSWYGSSVDSQFDNATMVWSCHMHNTNTMGNSYYQLTQARIDNLAARFGYSLDTTPDVGVHGVLFELAVQPVISHSIIEIEDGAFNCYVKQGPNGGEVVAWLVTTPPGTRGATLSWVIDGVPGSQYVGPDTTWEKVVGAASITNVTEVTLEADPEPEP
jgi:hypothetical protein